MLGLPRPCQRLGYRRLVAFAAALTQGGQLRGIANAGHDGLDDGHARHAQHVADRLRQFHVHLLQSLLHAQHEAALILDEAGAVSLVTAPDANRLLGAEGGTQKPQAVQPVNPHTILDGGLGPAWSGAPLVGIDEQDAEAFGLEQVVKGNPVDASGFHGNGSDRCAAQPFGQAAQKGGASGGALGHAAVGDGDPRLASANVDAGGVGVEGLQEGGKGGIGLLGLAGWHVGLENEKRQRDGESKGHGLPR